MRGFTNINCWKKPNKQVDAVNSEVRFADFTSMLKSNLADEPFTINFNPINLICKPIFNSQFGINYLTELNSVKNSSPLKLKNKSILAFNIMKFKKAVKYLNAKKVKTL